MRTLVFVAVVSACTSTEPPPRETPRTAPTQTPSRASADAPAAVDEIVLRCAFAMVPASAADGRREVARSVELRTDVAFVQIEMDRAPHRGHVLADKAGELPRLFAQAGSVRAAEIPAASPPVPDGPRCTLRIANAGTPTFEGPIDVSPAAGPLRDMVAELQTWMHAPEPASEPNAAEIDACRRAVQRSDIDRFALHRVFVEADARRYEFLRPATTSTDDHFACRVKGSEVRILPEG